MGRPLVISPEVQTAIKKVKSYAELNHIPLGDVKKMASGEMEPIGNDDEHSCLIPFGFRCVYSIEEQPTGTFRHLSVSVDAPGKYPAVEAVNMVMKEFGFLQRLGSKEIHIWEEKEADAINVLERI
jgi:hypothetical protein